LSLGFKNLSLLKEINYYNKYYGTNKKAGFRHCRPRFCNSHPKSGTINALSSSSSVGGGFSGGGAGGGGCGSGAG